MSTVRDSKGRERVPSAASLRRVRWYQEARWKRLVALLVLAVVGAQVTGVQGTSTDIFYALGENFTGTGIWIWLALCVGVWVIREFLSEPVNRGWVASRDRVSQPVARVRGVWQADPRLRYGGGALLLVVLILLPLWLSTYWQQVMVDQIAIFVLLAIGLNVVIGWAGMLDLALWRFLPSGPIRRRSGRVRCRWSLRWC